MDLSGINAIDYLITADFLKALLFKTAVIFGSLHGGQTAVNSAILI